MCNIMENKYLIDLEVHTKAHVYKERQKRKKQHGDKTGEWNRRGNQIVPVRSLVPKVPQFLQKSVLGQWDSKLGCQTLECGQVISIVRRPNQPLAQGIFQVVCNVGAARLVFEHPFK